MHALESLPLLCYAIFVGPFFLNKAEWPQGGYFMNEIAKKVMAAMLAIQRYPGEQGVWRPSPLRGRAKRSFT